VTTTPGGRGRRAAAWSAMLLAAAPLERARELPIPVLESQLASSVASRRVADGIALPVQGETGLVIPLPGVEALEIQYRSTGTLQITWTTTTVDHAPAPFETPWHHERVPPGRGRLVFDLRTTPHWRADRLPYFLLEGSGEFTVTGVRVRLATGDPATDTRSFDEAIRWSPIRLDHATVNRLGPPVWTASRGVLLLLVLGIAFLVGAVGGALAWLGFRKRWRPAPFLAVAGVACALAADGVFLVRAWPMLAFPPRLAAEDRLANDFALGPELGELTALARRSLRPGDRVGVQAKEPDWFAWETICFHLAPRPCVKVVPGATTYEGLSGVKHLTPGELDAVVYLHAGVPLLPGFGPAESLGPEAFVARRR